MTNKILEIMPELAIMRAIIAEDHPTSTSTSLRAENEKLKADNNRLKADCEDVGRTYNEQEAENERLREALEWFADANNYEESEAGDPSEVACEGVRKARAALQTKGEKE